MLCMANLISLCIFVLCLILIVKAQFCRCHFFIQLIISRLCVIHVLLLCDIINHNTLVWAISIFWLMSQYCNCFLVQYNYFVVFHEYKFYDQMATAFTVSICVVRYQTPGFNASIYNAYALCLVILATLVQLLNLMIRYICILGFQISTAWSRCKYGMVWYLVHYYHTVI